MLVTGHTGLVGRAVVARLTAEGVPIIGVSRRAGFSLDDADLDLVAHVATRPRAILHLAAAVPHASEYPDDERTAARTRRMDEAVARAAEKWSIRVHYASTAAVYDRRDPQTKTEEAPVGPHTAYVGAKLDGEKLFAGAGVAFRLAAPYGPGLRRTLVLGRFLEVAWRSGVIEIWGRGTREQDFLYARDVASAFIAALQNDDVSGPMNLASGFPVTMSQLAAAVVATIGRGTVETRNRADPREGETARYGTERARNVLSWSATVPLSQGLADMRPEHLADA